MDRSTGMDFALTCLMSQFHEDWGFGGTKEAVVDREIWNSDDPRAVGALRRDALLLECQLESGEIEALWNAGACVVPFGPGGFAPNGRSWMETIVARCDDWFAQKSLSPNEHPDPAPGFALVDRVVDEIWALDATPTRDGSPHALGDGVAPTLVRCARQCTPDLAMRLLLRVARRIQGISREQYARLQQLGEELEYGEFVVSSIEFLTE